jgi:hypothetical protein
MKRSIISAEKINDIMIEDSEERKLDWKKNRKL